MVLLLPALAYADGYFQVIPMNEVLRLMNKPGVVVLDVNVPEVWEQHHLPGAVHVDGPDLAKFLPRDKKSTLIFYCAGPMCSASGLAADESVLLGYRQVYVMTDGIFRWVKVGNPVISGTGRAGSGPTKTGS